MKVWGYTDVGKVRKNNQDSYYMDVLENGTQALCVVCDGMGGAKAGNIASKLATETFVKEAKRVLKPGLSPKELEKLVSESAILANQSVHEMASSDESFDGMGTTLVGVIAVEGEIVVINVGDSRAYLIDSEGIRRITRDHSLVEDMVEMGEITLEEAKEHPGKNLITRAIGTDEKVKGDVYTLKPEEGAYILLCTDGLSNLVTDQEILYEVLYGGNPDECCKRLTDIANDRGGFDNITAVLLAV